MFTSSKNYATLKICFVSKLVCLVNYSAYKFHSYPNNNVDNNKNYVYVYNTEIYIFYT
jgi:hypothetical protein